MVKCGNFLWTFTLVLPISNINQQNKCKLATPTLVRMGSKHKIPRSFAPSMNTLTILKPTEYVHWAQNMVYYEQNSMKKAIKCTIMQSHPHTGCVD